MKIVIFGATGMVGKYLVSDALIFKHFVRAFGRNVFTAPFPKNDNLQLMQGALFDEEQVLNAVEGCEAVLSVIGGSMDGLDKTRSLGMKNIVSQMEKAGVKRIVALGGAGILDGPNKYIMHEPDYPEEFLAVGMEHLAAYETLVNSTLDWSFICAPNILNEGPTGEFITTANVTPSPNLNKINAGDIALFMLQELDQNRYLKKRIGISATK
ncbi:MAG: NAD(P)H-binding protein [Ferruginibacter sp.]|nr:NAD(P)H-binding protein [Ferruginibacter sp.]